MYRTGRRTEAGRASTRALGCAIVVLCTGSSVGSAAPPGLVVTPTQVQALVAQEPASYAVRGQRVTLRAVPDQWVLTVPVGPSGDAIVSQWRSWLGARPSGSVVDVFSRVLFFEAATIPHELTAWVQPVWREGDELRVPSDRVLVHPADGVGAERVAALVRGEVLSTLQGGATILRVPGDIVRVTRRLARSPLVASVEPDFGRPMTLHDAPNDPFFGEQWNLSNTGQSGAVAGADIGVLDAWEVTRGTTDVVVAVLDTGIDPDHEDLDGCKLLPAYDAAADGPATRDYVGHGTQVAGVLGAWADNGRGTAGVCPRCRLLPVQLGSNPATWFPAITFPTDVPALTWSSTMARAIERAVQDGVEVINISFGAGTPPLPQVIYDAVSLAADTGRDGLGIPVVVSAGNESASTASTAWSDHPHIMIIGGTTDQDGHAHYANFGPHLSLSAPTNGAGHLDGSRTSGIWTTDISGLEGNNPGLGQRLGLGDLAGDYSATFGGTSAAAPTVAGAAALLLSANPGLTAAEVRSYLEQSAAKIDQAGGSWGSDGFSPLYGHGRLDVGAAMALAFSGDPASLDGGACDAESAACAAGTDCAPACGEVDVAGHCDGQLLSYCEAGRLVTRDCTEAGGECGLVDGKARCSVFCERPESGSEVGSCAGDVAVSCTWAGVLGKDVLISARARRCQGTCQTVDLGGQGTGQTGAVCLCDFESGCDGDVATVCNPYGETFELTCEADQCNGTDLAPCSCAAGWFCADDASVGCSLDGSPLTIECPETCGLFGCECDTASSEGSCADSDTFAWCANGVSEQVTCDGGCGGGDPENGPCQCDGVPKAGMCDGDSFSYCAMGQTITWPCAYGCGPTLGYDDGALDAVVRTDACHCDGMDRPAVCEGELVRFCLSGESHLASCTDLFGDAADGMVCKATDALGSGGSLDAQLGVLCAPPEPMPDGGGAEVGESDPSGAESGGAGAEVSGAEVAGTEISGAEADMPTQGTADDDEGGCSAGGRGNAAPLALLLLTVAVLAIARRSRRSPRRI